MELQPDFSVDFKLHLLKSAIWLHNGRRFLYLKYDLMRLTGQTMSSISFFKMTDTG